jgi:hypothetical protein
MEKYMTFSIAITAMLLAVAVTVMTTHSTSPISPPRAGYPTCYVCGSSTAIVDYLIFVLITSMGKFTCLTLLKARQQKYLPSSFIHCG